MHASQQAASPSTGFLLLSYNSCENCCTSDGPVLNLLENSKMFGLNQHEGVAVLFGLRRFVRRFETSFGMHAR